MPAVSWGVTTDPGRVRPGNEDNALALEGAFIVADGMGGHRAGEVAAQLAVDLLRERLTGERIELDDVVAAVAAANEAIFRAANANADQQGMGTTVTGIVLLGQHADPAADDPDPDADAGPSGEDRPVAGALAPAEWALVNVGDSRTDLFRHGRLRRVTVDHSYVQELVATGHITDD